MAAKANEKPISIREFSRRLGVSDTAVRNEIFDTKFNKNGCLRAGVGKDPNNKRPNIVFDIAIAEWIKAGRTIKNEEYRPKEWKEVETKLTAPATAKAAQKKKVTTRDREWSAFDDEEEDEEHEAVVNQPIIAGSQIPRSTNKYEAERLSAVFAAGIKEVTYLKLMGSLAPVERVRQVLFEYGRTIKEAILQMPPRIASRMRAAESDREAEDIMYVEIEALLVTLSTGPTESMTGDAQDDFDKDSAGITEGD